MYDSLSRPLECNCCSLHLRTQTSTLASSRNSKNAICPRLK